MQEMRVQSLGQKDLLEEEMATHCSILAWIIPWTKEPGGLQSIGLQRVEEVLEKTLEPHKQLIKKWNISCQSVNKDVAVISVCSRYE